MSKPLRCLLRIHAWRRVRNDEGQAYLACTRCSASRDTLTLNDFSGGGF